MRQNDWVAAANTTPRARAIVCPRGRGGKKNDLEAALAFQIRQCAVLGLPYPVGRGFGDDSQFLFAAELKRKFSVDFAWPSYRLLVEVQGGIWNGGAHGQGWGIQRDIEKAQLAAVLGYVLMPVSSADIRQKKAIQLIQLALERLGWKPGSSAAGVLKDSPEGRTSPAPASFDAEFNDPLP